MVEYIHRKIGNLTGANMMGGDFGTLPPLSKIGENKIKFDDKEVFYELLSQGNVVYVDVVGYVVEYRFEKENNFVSIVDPIPKKDRKDIESLIKNEINREVPINFLN